MSTGLYLFVTDFRLLVVIVRKEDGDLHSFDHKPSLTILGLKKKGTSYDEFTVKEIQKIIDMNTLDFMDILEYPIISKIQNFYHEKGELVYSMMTRSSNEEFLNFEYFSNSDENKADEILIYSVENQKVFNKNLNLEDYVQYESSNEFLQGLNHAFKEFF